MAEEVAAAAAGGGEGGSPHGCYAALLASGALRPEPFISPAARAQPGAADGERPTAAAAGESPQRSTSTSPTRTAAVPARRLPPLFGVSVLDWESELTSNQDEIVLELTFGSQGTQSRHVSVPGRLQGGSLGRIEDQLGVQLTVPERMMLALSLAEAILIRQWARSLVPQESQSGLAQLMLTTKQTELTRETLQELRGSLAEYISEESNDKAPVIPSALALLQTVDFETLASKAEDNQQERHQQDGLGIGGASSSSSSPAHGGGSAFVGPGAAAAGGGLLLPPLREETAEAEKLAPEDIMGRIARIEMRQERLTGYRPRPHEEPPPPEAAAPPVPPPAPPPAAAAAWEEASAEAGRQRREAAADTRRHAEAAEAAAERAGDASREAPLVAGAAVGTAAAGGDVGQAQRLQPPPLRTPVSIPPLSPMPGGGPATQPAEAGEEQGVPEWADMSWAEAVLDDLGKKETVKESKEVFVRAEEVPERHWEPCTKCVVQ